MNDITPAPIGYSVYLGNIIVSDPVKASLRIRELLRCLHRHAHGDWMETDDVLQGINLLAISEGGTITSVFRVNEAVVLIKSAGDRSRTTVVLANEMDHVPPYTREELLKKPKGLSPELLNFLC